MHVNKLFNNDYFHGFLHHSEKDIHSIILNNFEWMKRGLAEKNPDYKQPIAYCIIINQELKKIFVYQRSTNAGEERLHNLFTIGIGGHIDTPDFNQDKNETKNPIRRVCLRTIRKNFSLRATRARNMTIDTISSAMVPSESTRVVSSANELILLGKFATSFFCKMRERYLSRFARAIRKNPRRIPLNFFIFTNRQLPSTIWRRTLNVIQ